MSTARYWQRARRRSVATEQEEILNDSAAARNITGDMVTRAGLFGFLGVVVAFGFIGIFLGPTLPAVAYSLFLEWI
ncbi:hypothetical protein [Sinorhizobium fredii]|uniref:hypothetical protein n=1 Tax=Rhizobium fredii TaxID=380 RepID=UPI0033962644